MRAWFKGACGLAACAIVVAACASGSTDEKPLVISKATNAHLEKYMHEIQQGRSGAFAVNEDGHAAFYSVCESGSCNGQFNFSTKAVRGCEKFGRGHCFVLAANGVIKRKYTVGD